MRHSSLVTTITLAGALAFGAVPALAQRGGGGHGGGGHGGGGHGGGGSGHVSGGGGHLGGGHVGGGGTFNRGGRYWNVAPLHYHRPDHAFRQHFGLGFGLWAGYPVEWAYPYYFPPYPYRPS